MDRCLQRRAFDAYLLRPETDVRLMLDLRLALPAVPADAAAADNGRPLTDRPTDEDLSDAAEAEAGRAAEGAAAVAADAASGSAAGPPRTLLMASFAALRWAPSSPDSAAVSSPGANRAARASARRRAAPLTSAALSVVPMARACGVRSDEPRGPMRKMGYTY
jgi:hypothetical protein